MNSQDLLPILVTSADNPILRNDVIRLLVNLTQPAYLCFGGEYPKNKESDLMKCFLEVKKYVRTCLACGVKVHNKLRPPTDI